MKVTPEAAEVEHCRWAKSAFSFQRTGEKMAALRVAVLSGNGRALLNTSKTTKTLTVCSCWNIRENPQKRFMVDAYLKVLGADLTLG